MAVLRQSQSQRLPHQAIVLDLGDLRRQGEIIQARAREQAEAIVAQAVLERQRLIAGAHELGFAEGQARGHEEGVRRGLEVGHAAALAERREALARLDEAWTKSLAEFAERRDAMLTEARQDLLTLAVMIAQRLAHRTIQVDPNVAAAQLADVLALLARPTRLTVQVNPADEAICREALPGLMAKFPACEHAELTPDPSLPPGSCVARTAGGGTIDASIPAQLDRIVAAILPERPIGSPP